MPLGNADAVSIPTRDRRHGRRQQSLTEIVDVAVEVMAEQGAAGLSLGEVARRVGMQTPSLYVYFASKNALYDAVFARGWQGLQVVLTARREQLEEITDLEDYLLGLGNAFVRWAVEHPAYSQLMFWRPVPGFTPSAEAYQPALETLGEARHIIVALQSRGLLASSVSADRLLAAWTVLITGVITQQLANAPQESFDDGTFTALVPDLVAMFVRQYARSVPRARKP
jgi:AcrR family transcriptional regulator